MPTTEEYELEYMRLMTLTHKELNEICKEQGQHMYHHQKKNEKVIDILLPDESSEEFNEFMNTYFWKLLREKRLNK